MAQPDESALGAAYHALPKALREASSGVQLGAAALAGFGIVQGWRALSRANPAVVAAAKTVGRRGFKGLLLAGAAGSAARLASGEPAAPAAPADKVEDASMLAFGIGTLGAAVAKYSTAANLIRVGSVAARVGSPVGWGLMGLQAAAWGYRNREMIGAELGEIYSRNEGSIAQGVRAYLSDAAKERAAARSAPTGRTAPRPAGDAAPKAGKIAFMRADGTPGQPQSVARAAAYRAQRSTGV